MNKRALIYLLILLTGGMMTRAQEITSSEEFVVASDSIPAFTTDSIPMIASDSVAVADTVARQGSPLEAPVIYSATDSIVMTAGNWAYLFGEGDVKYQNIQLQSEIIEMNMDSSTVHATFGLDSIGQEIGYPLFKEGEEQYESKSMRYNFRTKKGYISSVITQQGEGYVTANRTKKMEDNALNMVDGRYTTCDNHDHPHFYIQMTKAKVRPKKNIVTGPVYLVIEDVPLPLALPFCFFPFSSSYQSGIIMPSFGDDNTYGFSLRDGGYYFAISDYVDLALTGEIYTKGSWSVSARSSYRKRYRYSGSFNGKYQVNILGEKELPDYQKSKQFQIQWTHSQDAKANPFRTFSASVNFSTSNFDRNHANGFLPGANGYSNATTNQKTSTVNVTQRFPNSPFTISGTFSINQRSQDSTLAVTLPDISITMSRIFPFKRKQIIGRERWYEKISMSYTGSLRNNITTKENEILQASLLKDWNNAMQHSIPVSATFNVFNYINVSPTFNYRERWYTSKVEQEFDPVMQAMAPSDTTYGFFRLYDYNFTVSANTTIYGDFKPLPFLEKLTKIKQIRHRMEPSIGFTASPDFGSHRYGYYEDYAYIGSDGKERLLQYSPFSHNQFGVPGRGRSGNISFGVDNNLEMKVNSDTDSTGVRKISLIDKLSLNSGYNLAVDSFQWNDLTVGLRMKFSKSYTLNMTGVFDVYTYEPITQIQDGEEVVTGLRRIDVPRWKAGKGIGRLMSTSTSFSYTFDNNTFRKWFGGGGDEGVNNTTNDPMALGPDELNNLDDGTPREFDEVGVGDNAGGRLLGQKKETGERDSDGYLISQIPWSLSFSYTMRLGYDRNKIDTRNNEYKRGITHSLTFNGNIQPTKNWRFDFNATYDFDEKKISFMTCNIRRDLHCFTMSATFVPVGPRKMYAFSIAVSSSLLKDLKYNQSANYMDTQRWY